MLMMYTPGEHCRSDFPMQVLEVTMPGRPVGPDTNCAKWAFNAKSIYEEESKK
jgi:hypothetical protein